MNILRFSSLLVVISGLYGVALGDEPVGPIQFRTLAVSPGVQGIYYRSGGKNHAIEADTHYRSPYYSYNGPLAALAFFRLVPGGDGKLVPQPVGSIDVSALGKRPLLLFISDPSKPGSYLVRGFADSSKDIPAGGYRLVNLTASQVGITLGTSKLLIPPGGEGIMAGDSSTSATASDVVVYGIMGQTPVPVYSSIWTYNSKRRSTIIIVPSPGRSSGVEVRKLPENVSNIPSDEAPTPVAPK